MHTSYWHPPSSQTQSEIQELENIFLFQYEKIASQQQSQLNTLKEILDEFERAEVQALPLKGADLLLRSPVVRGLRSMCDIDLLIRKQDLASTVTILEKRGFIRYQYGKRFLAASFANESLDYLSKDRQIIFDISWTTPYWDEREVLRLWDRALLYPTPMGERKLLHPQDSLLYLTVHAVIFRGYLSPSFIQDLSWVLIEEEKIDWIGWCKEVRKLGLQAVVYHGLTYACREGEMSLPQEVLERLRPRSLAENGMAWLLRRMVVERCPENPTYLVPLLGAPRWKGKMRILQRAFFPDASFIQFRCGEKSLAERLLVGWVRPFRILFRSLKVLPKDFARLLGR